MAQSEAARNVKFKVLPRLLDHIGLAMYSSVPKAISELVANSHDAGASEVFIDFTEKDGQLEEILIRDNGHGMSPEELESAYLSLGYNRREKPARDSDRPPIGNKGIGKLAGLGIAKVMEVTTAHGGKLSRLTISRDHFHGKEAELSDINFQ